MNLKGKLVEIDATQQVSDKFKKRAFVVEHGDNPQYMEQSQLEFIQDKCDLLDKYKVGDDVDVEFNLKGRAFVDKSGTKRYFNTLQAWKIVKAGSQPDYVKSNSNEYHPDDLPF